MNERFQYNSTLSTINVDNAVASILSKFEPDFIMHIIDDSLKMKFRPYLPAMPNVVYSFEQTFKMSLDNFESYGQEIDSTRTDTYIHIIRTLCRYYNLEYKEIDQDYYSSAYHLYDFLVSNFTEHIISFFANFIMKEKNFIYDSFNMGELKKNKDASTLYSKKMFKNAKLGTIHANVDMVLTNMTSFDINIYMILNNIYNDQSVARYIDSIVADCGDFYKNFYVPYVLDPLYRSDLITGVKGKLQQFADADIDPIV